jgi:hypothetical protein
MLLSSGVDAPIVSVFATRGILMASLPPFVVEGLLGAVVVYLFFVDYLKIAIFRRFRVT